MRVLYFLSRCSLLAPPLFLPGLLQPRELTYTVARSYSAPFVITRYTTSYCCNSEVCDKDAKDSAATKLATSKVTTRPDQLRVLVRILVRNLVRILVATNLVATNQPSPKVQPQARPKPTPETARADLNPQP